MYIHVYMILDKYLLIIRFNILSYSVKVILILHFNILCNFWLQIYENKSRKEIELSIAAKLRYVTDANTRNLHQNFHQDQANWITEFNNT